MLCAGVHSTNFVKTVLMKAVIETTLCCTHVSHRKKGKGGRATPLTKQHRTMTDAQKDAFRNAESRSDNIQDIDFWEGFVEVYVDGRTLRHTPETAADVVDHHTEFDFNLPA